MSRRFIAHDLDAGPPAATSMPPRFFAPALTPTAPTVTLPPGATGPVPAIIAYGGSSFTDAILQEGVAVINYAVGPVGGQFDRNPKTGAFYAANPDFQATGTLLAWAWGVSRMIDVIEQSGTQIIDLAAEHASIRKFLKSDPDAETGSLDPAPQLGGELAPNIAWETPTLE